MVVPAIGAVVLVRFPFSDLSQSKLRPALVLANAGRGDQILCQVTSKPYGDAGKLFTASHDLVTSQPAVLKPDMFRLVVDAVVDLLRSSVP